VRKTLAWSSGKTYYWIRKLTKWGQRDLRQWRREAGLMLRASKEGL